MSNNLREERKRIINLLAKGVINADEAERLLNALDNVKEEKQEIVFVDRKKAPFRMLKLFVDTHDGDQVRMQIPIEFAKLLKSNKFTAKGNFDFNDVDIDIDKIIEMINMGVVGEIVNVSSAQGDIVKIVVE